MTALAWLTLILSYLGVGVVFLLAYILVYKPDNSDAQLGLTVLFWPLWVLADAVLAIGSFFGSTVRGWSARMRTQ